MLDWIRVDVDGAVSVLLRLLIAWLLAIPVGWERERRSRSLGLRTFPLVAMASAAYLTIAEELYVLDANAQARVLQGLVAGIGFIGGGAILRSRDESYVTGTATAAAVWATGAVGASVAYGRLDIAICISAITFATFRWVTPFKTVINGHSEVDAVRNTAVDDEDG